MKHFKIKIWLIVLLVAPLATAAVRYVPTTDYPTIQAAVNACSPLDTVIVAPGTYKGSGNRDINLNGKTIILQSTNPADPLIVNTTVIDCEGDGRGFVFQMAENGGSTIAGFTVTNGNGLVGGAVYCSNSSSPLITNCVFVDNSAYLGGAIACANTNTSPKITNCTIKENSALVGGGAIYCNGASPNIANSLIIENSAPKGAAVYTDNAGKPVIENCTISQNTASSSAGGIYCYQSSNLTANNTIIWANTAPSAAEIQVANSGLATTVHLSYCDVRNPAQNIICASGCYVIWGPGNIDADPCFINADSNDFHLGSDSPCIDAGDPGFIPDTGETDIDGDPRIAGTKIDIGADEVMLAIRVLSPNGSEVLIAGDIYPISWSSNGSISNVLIEYSIDNGTDWNDVNTVPNTGNYNWYVPLVSSDQCLVRVSDASHPDVNDISDGVFTINNPPVAIDDADTTNEDTAVTINVLANDTDVDGDSLIVDSVTQPANGSALIINNSVITYTPAGNFNGVDSFTYTVSDGKGGTDTATVIITVNSVNDSPIANAGTDQTVIDYDGDEFEQVTLNGSGSTDVDGTIESYIWSEGGSQIATGVISAVTLSVADSPHTITLTVTDNNNATDTDTVLITVKANSVPVAYAGPDRNVYAYISAGESTNVILNGSGSYDPDGDVITNYSWTWTIGSETFTTAGVSPTIQLPLGTHTIELVVKDGFLDSLPDTAIITVLYDIPPVSDDQSIETNEDEPNDITLTASDADDDDLTLTYKFQQPHHGSLTGTAPNLTYTPNLNYYGSDEFTFTAYDGKLYSNEATVFITVFPLNDPPDAVNDIAVADANKSNDIYVCDNDSDPDYDLMAIIDVTEPNHGTVQNMVSYIEYTPDTNYLGQDSFEYTIADDGSPTMSDTAIVTVTVREPPLPPVMVFEELLKEFNIAAGYSYNLTVNITNEDSISHDLNDLFVLDQVEGLSMQFVLGDTVGAWQTFPATLQVDATNAVAGTYQVQAECLTDGDSERADYSELRFIITPDPNLPDIVLTSEDVNFVPLPGIPGSPTTISAAVKNTGLDTAENITVYFTDLENTFEHNVDISSLTPDQTQIVSTQHTWPDDGFYLITVTADPNNGLKEFDKNNNSGSKVYQVGSPPPGTATIKITYNKSTQGSSGTIEGTVLYNILLANGQTETSPVKGGLVQVVFSDGTANIELTTDIDGSFEVSFSIPNHVVITATDGTLLGTCDVSFYVNDDLWVDNINFVNNDPNIIIAVDIHAKNTNIQTISDVPLTFYAYPHPSTGEEITIGQDIISKIAPGDTNTGTVIWENAPDGVYRIEAELGPGFSDYKSYNNKTTSCLRVGPEPENINVIIDTPIDNETVLASQSTLLAAFVIDNYGNVILPCDINSLILDINGVDESQVDLVPRFNWSSLRYVYSWNPPADAHGDACLNIRASYVTKTNLTFVDSDSRCVNVLDNEPPSFGVYTSPYYAQIDQSILITVNSTEQLLNDRLNSITVKDSAGEYIYLLLPPTHDTNSTQWLYQTETLTALTALGWAKITVVGTDIRGNTASKIKYFKVVNILPDFFINSYDIVPSDFNPILGEPITIYATVHAGNNAEPESDIPVTFYSKHSDESTEILIGETLYTGEIVPNGSAVVSTPWTNKAIGVYRIKAKLGPGFSDENTGNNEATRAILVGDYPFDAYFVVEVKERRSRTLFRYTCKVTLHNKSEVAMENILLELVGVPENITIIDSNVTLPYVAPSGSATSDDTCIIDVNRVEPIDSAQIIWKATTQVQGSGETAVHQESSSLIYFITEGDITGEGDVDISDLVRLTDKWLWTGTPGGIDEDIAPLSYGDGIVNFKDFAVLAEEWLK